MEHRGDWRRPCNRCGVAYSRASFGSRVTNGARYRTSACRECERARHHARKEADPERAYRNRRRCNLKMRYGISPECYDKMHEEQGGACAICRGLLEFGRTHVDHNHYTNEVRALLCASCNSLIGMAYESPTLLRRAVEFLEHHNEQT